MEPTDTDEGCNGSDKEPGKSEEQVTRTNAHTYTGARQVAACTLKIAVSKNWTAQRAADLWGKKNVR